jgi:hypothetical protein
MMSRPERRTLFTQVKVAVRRVPFLGPVAAYLYRHALGRQFRGSERYWIERYARGGNSGPGSDGELAKFKADVINEFVAANAIQTVIEFGSGDGNQLMLARYPRYLGFDVSPLAIERCRRLFGDDPTKRFSLLAEYAGERAELALSLDVIYHLIEDGVYERYMRTLFDAAERFVIVYASNIDAEQDHHVPHIRHRRFTGWIEANAPQWQLLRHVPNPHSRDSGHAEWSYSDFFIFERSPSLRDAG